MAVRIGLERLGAYAFLFQGKAIGIITNFTGILPDFHADTIDVFVEEGWKPARVFTPEHGLYGAPAGAGVSDSVHPKYGIPVVSLYGAHRKPAPEDLAGIDVLVYDIQDLGLRYYTYIYTMCYAMEAAAEAGIPFVVLDRPAPFGDTLEGACMREDLHTFVGDYALPVRYGLTAGEMAQYFRERIETKKTDLVVIPMEGYRRGEVWPETGLFWNTPSPAIPDYESAQCYIGGCFFEAVPVSEGRGTYKPFLVCGAPFVDMDVLYRKVRDELKDDRVVFRRRSFIPTESDYKGELCFGLEFLPRDSHADFFPLSLILLRAFFALYPERMTLETSEETGKVSKLEVLYGNSDVLDFVMGSLSLSDLLERQQEDQRKFAVKTEPVRIYH